ncbi:MAG: hypothetical protein EA355_01310 [Rhodobacteraceae bacterium]|nr:MAG: hypothetical protein EA355_01310 [Paracoccaceae bacterium]
MRPLLIVAVLLAPPALADLRGHGGPVRALSAAADGATALSGSFDTTAILWRLSDATATQVMRFHEGGVNAVADLHDGRLATGGEDGRVALWRPGAETPETVAATHGASVAGLAVSPGGETLASAGSDGVVLPSALAEGVPRALRGHAGPVNAVAFVADGRTLPTGGADGLVRRWDAGAGDPRGGIAAAAADPFHGLGDSRGARVFRACAARHTVTPDDGARAGPTLHGLFGRRIATAPGYAFSGALTGMAIVWTPETVAESFTVGPAANAPGTKMPEQRITDPDDLAALIAFLEETTR